jgi:hypothetical protein
VGEQGGEGRSELSLRPTAGHARTGSDVEEIALDNDVDAFGEIRCVGALMEIPGIDGAIEQRLDCADRLFDELALVGADEGVAGSRGREGDPDDRFFATGVIVGEK